MADVDEKTKKARAERREKLLAWYEEKDLPPVIGDYELRIIDEQHDRRRSNASRAILRNLNAS